MAVSIRLRREGARNRPYYKIVVADSRSPREGKFIEIIGTYDPKKPGANSTLNLERADYWISHGAQASDTVRSLIKKNKNPEAAAKKAEAAAAKKKVAAPKAAPAPTATPEPTAPAVTTEPASAATAEPTPPTATTQPEPPQAETPATS